MYKFTFACLFSIIFILPFFVYADVPGTDRYDWLEENPDFVIDQLEMIAAVPEDVEHYVIGYYSGFPKMCQLRPDLYPIQKDFSEFPQNKVGYYVNVSNTGTTNLYLNGNNGLSTNSIRCYSWQQDKTWKRESTNTKYVAFPRKPEHMKYFYSTDDWYAYSEYPSLYETGQRVYTTATSNEDDYTYQDKWGGAYHIRFVNIDDFSTYEWRQDTRSFYIETQPGQKYSFLFLHSFPFSTDEFTTVSIAICQDNPHDINNCEPFATRSVFDFKGQFRRVNSVLWGHEYEAPPMDENYFFRVSTFAKVGDDEVEMNYYAFSMWSTPNGELPNQSLSETLSDNISRLQQEMDEQEGIAGAISRAVRTTFTFLFVPRSTFFQTQLNLLMEERDKKFVFFEPIKNSFSTGVSSLSDTNIPPQFNATIYGVNVSFFDFSYIDEYMPQFRLYISGFIWVVFTIFLYRKIAVIINS